VRYLSAGHHLEQLTGDMIDTTDATRAELELARISLRIGDQLGNGLGRNRWIDPDYNGFAADGGNWNNVA
jgi:hypothetical protein